MKWFTSDTHFGHEAILNMGYKRAFENIHVHDEVLIETINSYVGPNDILYHLGDFSWPNPKNILARIKCKDVRLIIGNHDRHVHEFKYASDVDMIKIGEQKVFLSHYPHAYWPSSHYGSFHLYGHMHMQRERTLNDMLGVSRRSMDVGVDQADALFGRYRPFSEVEIMLLLNPRTGHDDLQFYRDLENEQTR